MGTRHPCPCLPSLLARTLPVQRPVAYTQKRGGVRERRGVGGDIAQAEGGGRTDPCMQRVGRGTACRGAEGPERRARGGRVGRVFLSCIQLVRNRERRGRAWCSARSAGVKQYSKDDGERATLSTYTVW
ncbi:hypothetical protein EI94DRAFT_1704077 [Lactarius quietus]|nr:hypothetical protein EI94DRAFT_1704077 [Lactarius quietus]